MKKLVFCTSLTFMLILVGCETEANFEKSETIQAEENEIKKEIDLAEKPYSEGSSEETVSGEVTESELFKDLETFATLNGERAVLVIDDDYITDEALLEIFTEVVLKSDFEWFTIILEDGTGFVFVRDLIMDEITFFDYGVIDKEGKLEAVIYTSAVISEIDGGFSLIRSCH